MAGTDHRQRRAGDRAPAVVLIEPQLGENIGTAARAMANFALDDLRLVRPRDGWPNEHARKAASGADWIIESARLFEEAADAIGDLSFV
jgi:tRNA/rRNA methyltransferase